MTEEFKAKAGEFEGPLDLLLGLIEKRKLHINDVSLAAIADDYIAYINNHPQTSMGSTANFVLVASTLVLIKSRSLLPSLTLTPEEQQSIEELENRLKIYQEMKRLSNHLKLNYGKDILYAREPGGEVEPVFSPTNELTQPGLLAAIKNIIVSLPVKEYIPQAIIKKVMSLEEVIDNLTKRVERAFKLKFSEFVGKAKEERVTVILSFLGMLELVKQGIMDVKQDSHFADIDMEHQKPGVPHY